MKRSLIIVLLSLAAARAADAGVLPEDRADVLLHSYDGGGVTIQGPSVLVRKQFAQKFSVSANHYVDRVQSASIDVVTTASPYEEERTQQSVGLDYLHDRWMMNVGFTNSDENDYTAETFSFGISQDIFGDLTTVSLGYSLGDDTVRRRGDASFVCFRLVHESKRLIVNRNWLKQSALSWRMLDGTWSSAISSRRPWNARSRNCGSMS